MRVSPKKSKKAIYDYFVEKLDHFVERFISLETDVAWLKKATMGLYALIIPTLLGIAGLIIACVKLGALNGHP